MTKNEKLQRVIKLCRELVEEDNEIIVQTRLVGFARELKVPVVECAIIYWAVKEADGFKEIFGDDIKISLHAK